MGNGDAEKNDFTTDFIVLLLIRRPDGKELKQNDFRQIHENGDQNICEQYK